MKKDFDAWNTLKKYIDAKNRPPYAHPREIWWCTLGVNIGAEIDGKNDSFERPIIIMKVYSRETLLVLPLTTREKNDEFNHRMQSGEKIVWVKLTQTRVISSKRLLRKVDILGEEKFRILKSVWQQSL